MSLINCPECGKEISDTCKKCIHCGYRLKKKSEKPPIGKNKPFLITAVVLTLIIITGAGLFTYFKMTYSVSNAIVCFKNSEYDKFEKILEYLTEGERKELETRLQANAKEIIEQYDNSEIQYTDAATALNQMVLFDVEEAAGRLAELDGLKLSKEAYNLALKAEQDGKLEEAYENLTKVLKTDSNYTLALQKSMEISKKLSADYLKLAQDKAWLKKFQQAITYIIKAIKYDPDNAELSQLYNSYYEENEKLKGLAELSAKRLLFLNEVNECPLPITSSIINENAIGNPTVSITVRNDASKTVDAYTANFYMYDNFNRPVNHYLYDTNIYSGIRQDKIKPGGSLSGYNYYWTPHGFENTTKFIAIITNIHYTDNTEWNMSSEAVEYAQIYADENIESLIFQ